MIKGYVLKGGSTEEGYQVLLENSPAHGFSHTILTRKWYMKGVVPLTFMDRLCLLFGQRLCITFTSLDGKCNAACDFLYNITRKDNV